MGRFIKIRFSWLTYIDIFDFIAQIINTGILIFLYSETH